MNRKPKPVNNPRYIRVGVDFYKVIEKTDRWGLKQTELKPWTRTAIKDDHGTKFIKTIPKFDDFDMIPDNVDYQQVVGGCYNRYTPLNYKTYPGEWTWTKILMEHVFGDQIHLGIRYFQILYLHPKRMLPILCLVSKERQTGKTTFVNWLSMLFGSNMAIIGSSDLTRDFNQYATSNVICVEETLIEKQVSIEKLKSYSTAKFVTVNEKFVQPYKLPFYGKFIITSNLEDRFARVDQEEIRFFVRKLGTPTKHNHNIESELLKEIPAFLHHLTTLSPVDFSTDRTGFKPAELNNGALENLKIESKSWLYQELVGLFMEYFANTSEGGELVIECKCSIIDIKNKWFPTNRDVNHRFLKHVLIDELGLIVQWRQRYRPFDDVNTKSGWPYLLKRSMFENEANNENNNTEHDDPSF